MDGKTYAYLDLAALPAVGDTLLDARPAFVFASNGSRLLFANAAAAVFFGERGMGNLLKRRFSDLNPIKAQVARLARVLPTESARLEILRLGQGVSLATFPAACRRLNLADASRAVLAIGTSTPVGESITSRAERLVDAIAANDCLAAVLNADGKVLAASGGYDTLAPAEPQIDTLIATALASSERAVKRQTAGVGGQRSAGTARFRADGRDCFLIIVGPVEKTAAVERAALAPQPVTPPAPLPVEATAVEDAELPMEMMFPAVEADTPSPAPEMPAAPPVVVPEFPPPVDAPKAEKPATELLHPAEDLDDVAQRSIEQGLRFRFRQTVGERHVEESRPEPAPIADAPSNIVRLPGPPPARTERLTGTEREAFRRIAEALGTREEAGEAERDAAKPEPPRQEPKAAAPEIDTRLLDRVPLGIAIFRDHKTLFANRTLLEILGYDSTDAFLAAGGAEAIFPGPEGLAGNIAAAGGKLAARRRDGESVPVKAWLHAVTFGGATALMLSLTVSRERPGDSEDELTLELTQTQSRAEELEAILDTATDGVIVIDGRGRIGNMNRAAEALFGIEASQFLGRYFTDLIADESQKAALDYLDGLASNGVASVLNDGREVIGRVPQGGLIPLFMTMGRIGASDKFCAVLRDITHWKNVEAELIAARRAAEAANAQKSDFLAKISHEIRTPLNAIIGFSEVMMGERFGPIGNDRYRDYLHDIHVSGAHLMSLINDLLDLSKIEAGKLDLSFEAVPVNATIQECVALMQPQANRERIIIRTSLSADVPNVVADQRSFRQILLNLMSNAVKFTRAGGQVIVSTVLEETGEVVVRIRDTGIGMTEKDIQTALKPFRQVATAKDDREHGTGLGLPLTKALVEANRATFAIDSAPNQGTLVKITFPTTRVLAG